MDAHPTDEDFQALFTEILTTAHKHSSYKFALARFLLDYSNRRSGEDGHVGLVDIADKFLDYYWPQYYRYRLRQGPPSQPAEIGPIMDRCFDPEHRAMDLQDVRNEHQDRVAKCIRLIESNCLDNVVTRFQNTGSGEKTYFFRYEAKDSGDKSGNKTLYKDRDVVIDQRAMDYLARHYRPLTDMAILRWTKFLERHNPGLPRIASKVAGDLLRESRNQGKHRSLLEKQASICFYCHRALESGSGHVDHVIPFDYIGETELWNLVLSCQECNCTKSSRLPVRACFDELLDRNQSCRDVDEYRESLDTLRDWRDDMTWHYRKAGQQGYAVWDGGRCGGAGAS